MMPASSILIADDHPLLLKGLEEQLKTMGHHIIYLANDGLDAYNQVVKLRPNLVILDINMPKMSGLEVTRKVRLLKNAPPIILLTLYQEEELYHEAQELGVAGYLFKHLALKELEHCIDKVLAGQRYTSPTMSNMLVKKSTSTSVLSALTPAERKILKLISQNKTSPQIAEMLFISLKTVTKHRSNIVAKLGLPKKTNSLLLWAQANRALFH